MLLKHSCHLQHAKYLRTSSNVGIFRPNLAPELRLLSERQESVFARPMMIHKRHEANLEYRHGNFERAISLYSYALKNAKSVQDAVLLLLSRSLARHSNTQYEQSLADAEAALNMQPGNEKGILRKSRAFYGLGKYAAAEAALLHLKEIEPDHPNLKGDLAKCTKRHQEANGLYDFEAMLKEATKKHPKPYMDRASYSGPAMQRKACPEEGKGQGMFATRDIEVGELLMVEKAFATVFNDEIPSTSGETQDQSVVDPKTGLTSSKSNRAMQEELFEIVIKELERNPSKIGKFARLYPGPHIREEVDPDSVYDDGSPVPIIDSRDAVLCRILYNSFAFPVLSHDFHWQAARSGTESPPTIHGRRDGSTTPTIPTTTTPPGSPPRTNPNNGEANTAAAGVAPKMDPNSSIGVWLCSSFFNHSCHPSVRRSFIGDMIIFRAQLPVTRGTELTIGYVTQYEAVADRRSELKSWGFECRCPRCEAQAQESEQVRDGRRKIMGELVDAFEKPNPTSMEDYFAQLERLKATYGNSPAREDPRTLLVLPCITIISAAVHEDMPDMVVKLALFMLRGLGFEILVIPRREWRVLRWGMYDDEVVGVMAAMWRAYAEVDPELVRQVEGYLRLAYLVVCGEDTSFEGRYGSWRQGFGAAGGKREESTGLWQDDLMVEKDVEKKGKGKQKEVVKAPDQEADQGNSTVNSSWPAEWRDSVREAPRPTQQDRPPSPPAEPLSPLYKTSFGEDVNGGEDTNGREDTNGGQDTDGREDEERRKMDVDEDGREEEEDTALDEEGDDMDALVKQVNTKLGITWKNGSGE